ncbi:hypothetical protein LNTAR_16438 [Lentisphaera araneosa HTCC2155]|uniref:Uncharacterized protein n=1 Tax=Lentisphaera araneosa HTCC2155 TaxID=313628 RepID=A6DQA2_9BACT|nr:AAA family ATPase [Lentisphaera araneosa]EDM26153.1 hypothetical protein LNTAR_16438 [Lentisphaera araneosa HTCC2155]
MDYDEFKKRCEKLGLNPDKLESFSANKGSMEANKLRSSDEIVNPGIAIEDLALAIGIMMVIAPPKIGKSSWLHSLLEKMSKGEKLNRRELKKLRCLLVDSESGQYGLSRKGLSEKQSDEFHILSVADMLAESVGKRVDILNLVFDQIEEYVIKYQIDVVALDAVYSFINENSKKEVQALLKRVIKLKSMGKLVVLVHHTRKDVKQSTNLFANMAGHSDLQRNFNLGVLLKKTDQHIVDESGKQRPVVEFIYECRDFDTPDSDFMYLGSDREFHICSLETLVDDRYAELPAGDIPLAKFITTNLPAVASEALETTVVIDMMDDDESIGWTRETLKKKLPEWEAHGYLRTIGKSPKRYYIGKKLEE